MSVATGDVAAILSGLAVLAFLESLSAVRQRQQQQQQQQHQQHQLQQPATFVERKHHPRKKPRPPPAAAVASKKQPVGRPPAASKAHHQSFPRHVFAFALPTFSSLPSRPGRFDGADLVERLLTFQARQPRPNFECRR